MHAYVWGMYMLIGSNITQLKQRWCRNRYTESDPGSFVQKNIEKKKTKIKKINRTYPKYA